MQVHLESPFHRRWVQRWWCASDIVTRRGRIGGGTGVGRTWVVVIEHRHYAAVTFIAYLN